MLPCDSKTALFFSDDPEDIEAAKYHCWECPLRQFEACQKEGFKHEFGVYGGLSPEDRQQMNPERSDTLLTDNQRSAAIRDNRLMAARWGAGSDAEIRAQVVEALGDASTKEARIANLADLPLSDDRIAELIGSSPRTVNRLRRRPGRKYKATL